MVPRRVRPGDILFYRVTPESSIISRIVAAFQMLAGDGSSETMYSHVGMVDPVDNEYQIDAYWPRVRRSKIEWAHRRIDVYRLTNVRDLQISMMVAAAYGMIGQRYDLINLLFGWLDNKRAQICTTLISESARIAGIDLEISPGKLITPNELAESPRLMRI
jgi:hypothetical protein